MQFYTEKGEICAQKFWRSEDKNCPLTSCTWQGRSSESRAPYLVAHLRLSVDLLGFYALASPLRDYKGLRFLIEGITVNKYKRACYWHQEKGQETLAEPQLCAELFAKCFTYVISFHSNSYPMTVSSFFSDYASQRPYNFAQDQITVYLETHAFSLVSHIRSFKGLKSNVTHVWNLNG